MQQRNFSAGHSSNSMSSKFQLEQMGKTPKNKKICWDVLEEYKKLCLKSFVEPNPTLIGVLKNESLVLNPEYSLKEILIINKLIGKHLTYKSILVETNESLKDYKADKETYSSKNISSSNNNISSLNPNLPSTKQISLTKALNAKDNKLLNQKLRQKLEDKQTRKLAAERQEKIYTLFQGISRNVSLSNELTELRLFNIRFQSEFAEFLCEALKANTGLSSLYINYCDLVSESSDIIIRGLIEHSKIEILDFSNNFLDDKTGYMISRLINRQSERRDETVWKYGLRNERPAGDEFKKGLAAINLSDNFLSDNSADSLAIALQTDTYLRSLCLSRNQIFLEGCKKLVRAMRRNGTLLNLDIRENYGYNENIHKRILVKISRNVKMTFKNFNEFATGYSKENEYLKGFVNYDFFNVEIPQEIIDRYQYMHENEEAQAIGNGYEGYGWNHSQQQNAHMPMQQYSNNPFASFGNPNYISGGNHFGVEPNYNMQVNKDYSAGEADEYMPDNSDKLRINRRDDNSYNSEDIVSNRERKPSNAKNSEGNVSKNNNNNNNNITSKNNLTNNTNKKSNNSFNNNNSDNKLRKKSSKNQNQRSAKDKKGSVGPKGKTSPLNKNTNKVLENISKSKQNSSDNSNQNYNNNNKNTKKNSSGTANLKPKANLDEKRFEYKVEKTQKNENKSKSEDIQFELEADNEYDKIINEENENDEDFIFRNYSDGEIFSKNEITNDINYSLPQNNQTNIDTYFAKDNNNKNVIEFNYSKNANKFFEKNKFCRCSRDFKKVYVDVNRKNKLLFLENLKLRKQLLTLRAINLSMNQQRLNNNNSNTITNNFEELNNNNPVTGNLSLTNNMNNISSKAPPMTGEDGSYELKYNKIENLLGELTRLMDNMENTLLPQNNTNNQNAQNQNLSLSRGNSSINNRRERGNYRRMNNERKQDTILEENN